MSHYSDEREQARIFRTDRVANPGARKMGKYAKWLVTDEAKGCASPPVAAAGEQFSDLPIWEVKSEIRIFT